MSVFKDDRGRWRFRKQWRDRRGQLLKINGTPTVNTKKAAEVAERRAIEEAENPAPKAQTTTFSEFWEQRYVPEWIEPENRAGTAAEKLSIYKHHLQPALGDVALAAIDVSAIQLFKAQLQKRRNRYDQPISPKTIDNILTVLAHALKYAEEVQLIAQAPVVRLLGAERPEPEPFNLAQLGAFLEAARTTSEAAYLAALLAADAGLRLGEIYMIDATDLNFDTGLIRVDESRRKGEIGTTKSGRTRYVPMTETLASVLRELAPKEGQVVRHRGQPVTETYLKHAVYRVCERAGLAPSSWHTLRHTFATHAARFGVSPWTLQSWLGHSAVSTSQLYVTLAGRLGEVVPDHVLAAGAEHGDPDRRAIAMLGARSRRPIYNAITTEILGAEIANDNDSFRVGGTGIEPATRAV